MTQDHLSHRREGCLLDRFKLSKNITHDMPVGKTQKWKYHTTDTWHNASPTPLSRLLCYICWKHPENTPTKNSHDTYMAHSITDLTAAYCMLRISKKEKNMSMGGSARRAQKKYRQTSTTDIAPRLSRIPNTHTNTRKHTRARANQESLSHTHTGHTYKCTTLSCGNQRRRDRTNLLFT